MSDGGKVALLRRHSLWLSHLTLFLLVATILIIVVPTMIGLSMLSGRGISLEPVLLRAAVLWSPTLFYLYALWAIRQAFWTFANGGVFGPAIAGACTKAGVALSIGAGFSAFAAPTLMRLMGNAGLLEPPPHMARAVLLFDTAYLAVGVVGLALVLMGRLLGHAADLQGEAAALRSELGEFI